MSRLSLNALAMHTDEYTRHIVTTPLRLHRLFTLKGREVRSVSDFFREDDVFIGVSKEELTTSDVQVSWIIAFSSIRGV